MLTPEEHKQLIDIDEEYRELCILDAFSDFWQYCLFMDYEFYYKRRFVLQQIAEAMQNLVLPKRPEDELNYLNVSICPRTGKSYITTLFASWCIGRFPTESIMRNSVTATLYEKFSADLLDIVRGQSHNGNYSLVFPSIKLKTESVGGWKLHNARQGVTYFGGGVGGTIIGFGASLLSILDDSVKNEEEALSAHMMDKKWGWYTSTMRSREEKGCKKLFIGTRWSKQDIVGRLESTGMFSESKFKNITVPALVNEKSFCEEIHTTERLLEERKVCDRLIWMAEWMQEPIEAEGLLFPSGELNYFDIDDLRVNEADGVIITGDIADEGADYLSCPVGYIFGDDVYIADTIYTTESVETSEAKTALFIDKHRPDRVVFESNNIGKMFGKNVQQLISHKVKIRGKVTTKNKETRILMKAGRIRLNFHFRNDDKMSSEYIAAMREMTSYMKTGKNKHDDFVDSITMMAEAMDRGSGYGW